jgi:hypothetical protein
MPQVDEHERFVRLGYQEDGIRRYRFRSRWTPFDARTVLRCCRRTVTDLPDGGLAAADLAQKAHSNEENRIHDARIADERTYNTRFPHRTGR